MYTLPPFCKKHSCAQHFSLAFTENLVACVDILMMHMSRLCFSSLQEQQRKGVIVATDCNFSMAVAHHAVELKIPVFVIMPSCCSSPRLRIYRDYGAMVISYGSTGHDSQNHARHLAKENGYLFLEESVPLILPLIYHTELTIRLSVELLHCCRYSVRGVLAPLHHSFVSVAVVAEDYKIDKNK